MLTPRNVLIMHESQTWKYIFAFDCLCLKHFKTIIRHIVNSNPTTHLIHFRSYCLGRLMWHERVEALKGSSIITQIYATPAFRNSLCFSGEWWTKAPSRHLRKSSVNHCKTFLLRNLSSKREQKPEQVRRRSVSMFPSCTCLSNMNMKAPGVEMSWKQSALSKLRSGLEASTVFVML